MLPHIGEEDKKGQDGRKRSKTLDERKSKTLDERKYKRDIMSALEHTELVGAGTDTCPMSVNVRHSLLFLPRT